MTKTTYLIGNWKMQLDGSESETLAKDLVKLRAARGAVRKDVVVAICPSHAALPAVGRAIAGAAVALGAQDAFWEDKGAYTGEISPKALKDLGCEYCLAGHSERREFVGETDAMVNKKVRALLRHDIDPVICVGETAEERRAGKRDAAVIAQVRAALEGGVRPAGSQRLIIAYEPRWVIGTGRAVEPSDAAGMHHLIRETLLDLLPQDIVEGQCAVIYGGSVDAGNLAGFLSMDDVHGVLVGGASLKAKEFAAMAEIAADIRK